MQGAEKCFNIRRINGESAGPVGPADPAQLLGFGP